ncbi:endonuclease/exonuclease/phosphatase family protein [Micrococcus porci]|uniref:endonuclease/exonuclease/phosphatase family protein n=1 Tax=Micrococcus TaxID=1269 RepID=UPI001CCA0232|nr:endonuclease/exonuclease/phosphatase family protein [Micrococcus porci]MCG7423063.1 endonuclease/exonuclease/phosphatase family protein [Micrococcus sp. ACRRV]UBH25196.1 endonuclease/exonuclease/phosphatase family protein [Micrococcus porci]
MTEARRPTSARSPVLRILARILTAALLLALAVLAVAVFTPHSELGQRLTTRLFLAQALAFAEPAGAGLTLLGLGVLALHRGAGTRRRTAVGGVAAMLLGLGVGLLAWPDAPPWAAGPATATGNTGRHVRVTVFNSLDTLTAADARRLIDETDPDVLVLPEAAPSRVREALAGTGLAGGVHEGADSGFSRGRPAGVAPTTIAMHPRLGAYHQTAPTPTTFGAIRLEPADGADGPVVVGVHTGPPLPRLMDDWRGDLDRLSAVDHAAAQGPMVVAGDLNATLRHGPLADRVHLADTALRCPDDVGGTWPSDAPGRLRSPIDHVLVTGDVEVLSCTTLRVGASDHLAYAAELRLPGT